MSLKALADMVLQRDTSGTNHGTVSHNLSQKSDFKIRLSGTVIQFRLTEKQREVWEERAAIMEYDAGLSREEAEAEAFSELTKGYLP